MTDTTKRIDDIYAVSLPAINEHIAHLTSALTQRLLDLDVHRRKWSLTVQGLKGIAGESEATTRDKCVELARSKLKIADADTADYAACHRLNRSPNAGIIMRFVDLAQRNKWLDGARNLKDDPANKDISISPDLPNALRPLKTELLNKRKALPPAQKANSSLRYLRAWPYMELRIQNEPTIRPTASLMSVCSKVLEVDNITAHCAEPIVNNPPIQDNHA